MADKKKVAAKPAPKAKKPAAKPVAKPASKKESKPAPKAKAPAKKEDPGYRNYHVVKRPEDGKWEVKFAGGNKALKLFKTQKEAIEYANEKADNQDGTVLVHNSKGANKGKIKSK